jgi:hypothetical protein
MIFFTLFIAPSLARVISEFRKAVKEILPGHVPSPLLSATNPPKIRLPGIVVRLQQRVISGGALGAQRSYASKGGVTWYEGLELAIL